MKEDTHMLKNRVRSDDFVAYLGWRYRLGWIGSRYGALVHEISTLAEELCEELSVRAS
jgi:hypothetical protein